MNIAQTRWTKEHGWGCQGLPRTLEGAQLVFAFGGTQAIANRELVAQVRQAFPRAHILGCSTAGEIHGVEVTDNALAVTAVALERTQIPPLRQRGLARSS